MDGLMTCHCGRGYDPMAASFVQCADCAGTARHEYATAQRRQVMQCLRAETDPECRRIAVAMLQGFNKDLNP